MNKKLYATLALVTSLILAGCGPSSSEEPAAPVSTQTITASVSTDAVDAVTPGLAGDRHVAAHQRIATSGDDDGAPDRAPGGGDLNLMAAISDIPYPIYPNGSKYRIGGENGLKIIAFETTDPFGKVDRFFTDTFLLAASDKPKALNEVTRSLVMADFVKYSPVAQAQTIDPLSTTEPGIVIHEFSDADDALAYGASPEAKTNIIMSFR